MTSPHRSEADVIPLRPDPATPDTTDRPAVEETPTHTPEPGMSGDGGQHNPPPTPAGPASDGPDEGEVLEGTVMVDRPGADHLDPHTRFMRAKDAQRRPIIAGWLRNVEDARATLRWAAGYAGHITAFHAVRIPVYALT